jgi:hypothetical protein
VDKLLEAVPEFADRYLALVEAADDDPGAAAALTELARFVAGLLASLEHHRAVLARCGSVLDDLASTGPDAEDLVTWAFLDRLSPDERRVLAPWFGARTLALVRELEPGPA